MKSIISKMCERVAECQEGCLESRWYRGSMPENEKTWW